jgi:hypothetical protein
MSQPWFQSPQMFLWDGAFEDWHLVLKLPEYAPRRQVEERALPHLAIGVATPACSIGGKPKLERPGPEPVPALLIRSLALPQRQATQTRRSGANRAAC